MGDFEGKVALITGAAGGVGSVTAARMGRAGAGLVLTDLPGTGLADVVASLRRDGCTVVAHEGDISDEDSVRGAMKLVLDHFGRLDIIDNVAAATGMLHVDTAITEIDVELWDRIVAVNARSVFLTAKHGIPVMLRTGGGVIINTSSGLGFAGDDHSPAYGAGKSAVHALTWYIATQYGKAGIRCNCIVPGFVLSPKISRLAPKFVQDLVLANTMGTRLCTPEDIANVALFLASDEAAMVNGELLAVNGGHRVHQPHLAAIREMTANGSVGSRVATGE
jgi:NAD(P)-dependent dehydrogenase (short-subunit alcohol dehydrogenase family)